MEKFCYPLQMQSSLLPLSLHCLEDIYDHMKEKPRNREFLSRYRIIYKQANEKDMDGFIIPPLQEKMKIYKTFVMKYP